MKTIGELVQEVTRMLAEESTVFWTLGDRRRAVNNAARFVAAVTKELEIRLDSTSADPIELSGHELAGVRGTWGRWGNRALPVVWLDQAMVMNPKVLEDEGRPKWIVVDDKGRKAYLSPKPTTSSFAWSVFLKVIPPYETDGQPLFNGREAMSKYTQVVTVLACAYLLLQERFDGDAERFYGIAMQELQALGVDSNQLPALQAGVGPAQGG